MSEEAAALPATAQEQQPTTTVISLDPQPVKRGRGRPKLIRDDHSNPVKPKKPGRPVGRPKAVKPKLDTSFDSAEDVAYAEGGLRPKRATRGKVPQRYKDTLLSEDEDAEGETRETNSVPKARGPGRPPKHPVRPPSPEQNANPDVTVNIAVKDKSCTQHLDLMGVYILYYCRKCAFSSKQMLDITEHIREGEHLTQPVEALEGIVMEDQTVETIVSEPLVSEALTEVAQEDLQNIVAKDKIVKTGGKFVKVDEHSYAEVTVEKATVPTAKGDAPDVSEEVVEAANDAEEPTNVEEVEDAGAMSDDSVADPDFDGGEAKEEEEESDHEIESDEDLEYKANRPPKKRGRKRKYSDSDEELVFVNENLEENSDLEEDPMVPRRYTCPQCPYTVLYSFNEFKEHRRCHRNASDSSLHCYFCRLSGKTRVMADEAWGRIKAHMAVYHNTDFKLPCPLCPAVLSQHSLFVRHYKSHLHSCKYDFCRYDTNVEEDMRLHTQCHVSTNPRHYSCPLCNFTSKLKPWKWPVMHYHLHTKHKGSMKANFTCKACDTGFFDTNSYIDHKSTCGKDEFTKCDLCQEDIPKASLVRHAVWHVRKAEGLIPPNEKFEFKTIAEPLPEDGVQLDNGENIQCESEVIEIQPDESTAKENEEKISTNSELEEALETVTTETNEAEDSVTKKPQQDKPTDSQDVEKAELGNKIEENLDSAEVTQTQTLEPQQSNVTENETLGVIEEVFQCIEHEETFESQAALTQHYVTVHWGFSDDRLSAARREAEQRIQDQEGRAFPSVEDNDVMRRLQQMRNSTRSGEPEKCQYCYKTFASAPRLLRHLTRCHTEEKLKPSPCPTCGKLFRNRVQLRNHIRIVHEGIKRRKSDVQYQARKRLFICELCGYTTPENIRLRNHHLSAHSGIMPYACEICQYRTNEKSDLRRHVAKHKGLKRHVCDYCEYKTDQRWLLVNHCMRQHNVQLPKHQRDTRGLTFGSRRKPEQQMPGPQIEQVIVEGGDEISLETLENLVQLQAVQNGEEVTIWMTTPEEYEAATNVEKGAEEVMAVESLNDTGGEEETPQVVYVTEQEVSKDAPEAQQIVYVREDGTIVSPEELMTIAVEGEEYSQQVEQSLIIEPQAMLVQEISDTTEDGQQIIVQENP